MMNECCREEFIKRNGGVILPCNMEVKQQTVETARYRALKLML